MNRTEDLSLILEQSWDPLKKPFHLLTQLKPRVTLRSGYAELKWK